MGLFNNVEYTNNFIGAKDNYYEAKGVLLGAPMDYTVSFRPGSRFAAKRIREVSYNLEEYSFYCHKDLTDCPFFDAGDLALPFGNVEKSLDIIYQSVAQITKDGKIPFIIGGDHLISYPCIKGVKEKYPDLAVLHFDAHADLREDYAGENQSHATVIGKVVRELGVKDVYQFGIRSGTKDEWEFAQKHTKLFPFSAAEPLLKVLEELKGKPIYITIDIDVVDPAFAPGTGTPEAGGITSKELLDCLKIMSSLNVVGFDIIEVAPVYDISDITSVLAAKVIRESLLMYIK
ncbi:agmatinase [Anaerobranca californiensis DSM 14826]|jgi:agmatinase|uniref:Agmatinase n=1 Tax=Anaerobranca californiensis DSM 14826 TaxID=1120989 RepID=A0A1M6M7S4_9FIRM|nr:agmatinase [Anaerobranca californiensis]SHJ79293.1 agmatinase [Anaerobranca californiensis DSM 14826]